MLRTTVLSAAMADGLEWRSWTPSRRRNFVRLLVDQVVVYKWPEGMATGLPKQARESLEEHRARVEAHQREGIRQRVTIVTK